MRLLEISAKLSVEGSPREGFSHEFKRNYDISITSRSKLIIFLGFVDARSIVDVPGGGSYTTDTTAADVIEEWALRVQAPGPSLRSSTASVRSFYIDYFWAFANFISRSRGQGSKCRIAKPGSEHWLPYLLRMAYFLRKLSG